MPWLPAEVALLWIVIVSAGVLIAIVLGCMIEWAVAREVRHSFRDDIPHWWG